MNILNKKIIPAILILICACAVLSGCSNNKKNTDTTAQETTAADTSGSLSDAVSDIVSDVVSDTTPDTTGENTNTSSLENMYNKVIETVFGEEAPRMVFVEDEAQIQETYGVNPDDVKASIIATPMMNVNVDTFVGFEAKEGKAGEIQAALEQYKADVIAARENFPYLPDHLPKAKKAQVVTKGNYVFYISLANVGEDVADEDIEGVVEGDINKAVNALTDLL